jgi:predicted Fe-Mo cluster-binding NifX family protein
MGSIVGWFLVLMTIQTAAPHMVSKGEATMGRVAISVVRDRESLHSVMDHRFGRAEAFLIVDSETGELIEIIDNASANASHGAGTSSANIMRSAGVETVISGRFGPKALDALQALGIETWIAPPGVTAREALGMLQDGGLERMKL